MDTSAFNIYYEHKGNRISAEIHPCCSEDNVVDYAVWTDDKLAFTIARSLKDNERWVVVLKNADDDIYEKLVQSIGAIIEKN